MMKAILVFNLVLLFLLCSCSLKKEDEDIIFNILDTEITQYNSHININIINKSNSTYFITLDTTRSHYYGGFDLGMNENILIKPIIYDENNDELLLTVSGITKYMTNEIAMQRDSCFKSEVKKSNDFFNSFHRLENSLILYSKDSLIIKIPFKTKYKTCTTDYEYIGIPNKKYF